MVRRPSARLAPALAALAALALVVVGVLVLTPAEAPAQQRRTAGYAWDDPRWRFTHHDRPVKVVLLAGSIGAYRDRPYGRLLHEWCENAEIRNLSQVGQGAPQLLSRFRSEVLSNPRVPLGAPNAEVWLLFGGGLNSVGLPHRTNRAVRRMFLLAHRRNVRVVAMTLTPWGDDGSDDERWADGRALHALRSTRTVVDFILGQASPREALGPFRRERRNVAPDGPWQPSERPDVAIDLYDSRLRARSATPWPLEDVRRMVEGDAAWRRRHAELDDAAREEALEADARFLSQAPRWFLRPEYRGFDHIHPNRAGHRVIAETACPRLPESWGCRCP
ncbi:MAG TPA: hypothetical protein RMH99_20875 [Sandaracinaceae bacterium LLY-WYZ-13_1]|nr:hypothetical protein [Sandaracinaceae bacterium LLY-WYZ-13_1]